MKKSREHIMTLMRSVRTPEEVKNHVAPRQCKAWRALKAVTAAKEKRRREEGLKRQAVKREARVEAHKELLKAQR